MFMTLLMLMKKKTVEAVLVDRVPISAIDNYNEVNLHLGETINSTNDQFKALIEKAKKNCYRLLLYSQ